MNVTVKMPVLAKDHSWVRHRLKLHEEHDELQQAIFGVKDNIGHVAAEALDTIQVCIGILDKVEEEVPGMVKKEIFNHNRKLLERGWKVKKVIQITED
ncbi:hypothetical protein Amet_2400 [Alkaliphilus metalliredigens QYMF]|uniref:NTP pyrophosphohydrolase MazG putative catalytic core domain-containing protein n=2 Tax=Alkaliphilus TaxID=114627 RepID=A6TQT6_ALKMQ|nr:hypothetical protein Amet_2400 [Alkaliphilus metalliredigens QYMF]